MELFPTAVSTRHWWHDALQSRVIGLNIIDITDFVGILIFFIDFYIQYSNNITYIKMKISCTSNKYDVIFSLNNKIWDKSSKIVYMKIAFWDSNIILYWNSYSIYSIVYTSICQACNNTACNMQGYMQVFCVQTSPRESNTVLIGLKPFITCLLR